MTCSSPARIMKNNDELQAPIPRDPAQSGCVCREKGPQMAAFSRFSQQTGQRSDGLGTQVVLPGQAGFDKARMAFNPAAHQRPAPGVFAESAHDVAAAA